VSITHKGTSVVDEAGENDDIIYLDIDDVSVLSENTEPARKSDRFEKIKINNLKGLQKRRANYFQKRLRSESGDAEAKFIDPEYINGYALYDMIRPPYDMEALATIFEENAFHNAAVIAKAINMVGLGYTWDQTRKARKKLEKANGDEAKYQRTMDSIHDEIERLEEIFEAFNEEETFVETLTKAVIDMLTLGNGYIEVGRNNAGEIAYVGHVPAYLLRIRRQRDGFIQMAQNKVVFFRNFGDKETPDPVGDDPRPNEIIHLKSYSPKSSYYGIPSIVSAMSAIVGDKFAKEYNIDYFENKAIPRYALVVKGAKLSEKSKKELIQYFRNEVKGKNHGTLIIPLPATMGTQVDVKFEKLENTVQDASFERYRKANRDEVITTHRVPPTKVGVYENANLAVSRDADKTFKEQVIGPEQERIEKRINRIVSEFTDLVLFKFVQLDIVDADMKSRIYDRYLRTEVLDPNEVRNEIGYPARQGGTGVLPFPTKVQLEIAEMQDKTKNAQIKSSEKTAKVNADAAKANAANGQNGPGAPNGNMNNPVKAGPETPKQDNGTAAERGQAQDTSGVRERSN
jgi:PBSX family phage portal protein